jgi:hypothetical protein
MVGMGLHCCKHDFEGVLYLDWDVHSMGEAVPAIAYCLVYSVADLVLHCQVMLGFS